MTQVVRLLAALMLGALLAPSIACATDAGDIVVVSLKGEVHFTMQGRARNIRAGGLLEPPVTLRTGRDGAVELRQGATTLSVGPETLLEFPALEKPGAPIDRIVQPLGNVFYDIGKRPGRKLRIETPYLVGVVKGTQFNVAAGDGTTTISLFEGLLEVRATDDSSVIDLKAGEIASRGHDVPAIKVLKMSAGKDAPPAAPRPSSGNSPGNGASPVSPRVAPRAHDRDSILVENSATIVTVGPASVTSQLTTAAPVEAVAVRVDPPAVSVSAPAVETTASVAADVPATDVAAGSAVAVSTPAVETTVAVTVDTPATGVSAGVEVGASAPDVAVDVGLGVDSGNTGTSVIVGASATQVEVHVGSDVAADAIAGTANLGLGIATENVDLGVEIPDATDSTSDTGTDASTPGPPADVVDLLDGLVRRPGKK